MQKARGIAAPGPEAETLSSLRGDDDVGRRPGSGSEQIASSEGVQTPIAAGASELGDVGHAAPSSGGWRVGLTVGGGCVRGVRQRSNSLRE
jgi:hypothetical protein